MRRLAALLCLFPALLAAGPRVSTGAGPRLQGSTLTLRFVPSPQSSHPMASGFHQKAAFYLADPAHADTAGLQYALLAVPLECKPGRYRVKVSWDEDGAARSLTLGVRVQARPGPFTRLRLPKKARRAADHLAEDKPLLDAAFKAQAAEPPRWEGSFLRPIGPARLSEVFGASRLYLPEGYVWRHKGLDLAAPVGSPVMAANDAVVALAKEGLKAYGGLVVLAHGYGLSSSYMHLSRILVQEGQSVKRGDLIALSGEDGISTGAHLHWQMDLRGIAVDPRPWMDKAAQAELE